MALDGLNQLGKYLHRTQEAIHQALTRYHPHYPNIERSRDIFDRQNSYTFQFRSKHRAPIVMDLDFDVPPILSECRVGCLHAGCKSIAVAAGTNVISVDESYEGGTVHVFLSGTEIYTFSEDSPTSGTVRITSGAGQITICYMHNECQIINNCVGGIQENCTAVTTSLFTFANTGSTTNGPFVFASSAGPTMMGNTLWQGKDLWPESGALAFPGTPQLWYLPSTEINRLSPYLNATAVDVFIEIFPNIYVFDSFAEAGMGMAAVGSFGFHDGGRNVFSISQGQTTTMTANLANFTDNSYIFQKTGDYFESALTGKGTWTVRQPYKLGFSMSEILSSTNGVTWTTSAVTRMGAIFSSDAGTLPEMVMQLDFLYTGSGDNTLRFGNEDIYLDIHFGTGLVVLHTPVEEKSYTTSFVSGFIYTAAIQFDLYNGVVSAKVIPFGYYFQTPWSVTALSGNMYVGSGDNYDAQIIVGIRNDSGNAFSINFKRLYISQAALGTGTIGAPAPITVVNLDVPIIIPPALPVPYYPVLSFDNGVSQNDNISYFHQWTTDGFGHPFANFFENDGESYGPEGGAHETWGVVAAPFDGFTTYETLHQQTGSVLLPFFQNNTYAETTARFRWHDGYFVVVTGEYNINFNAGVGPEPGQPHAPVTMLGVFETYNFGDTRGMTVTNYHVLEGGAEMYAQHSGMWQTSTGWVPFEFNAHNQGTNGGVSFGTGQGVAQDQAIFQWGVRFVNSQDAYAILDTLGWIIQPTIEVFNRGQIQITTRNVKYKVVKHDGTWLPIPECQFGCI